MGAFAASSVKTGMEFDSAMSQVAATMGMTTLDIEKNVDYAGDRFDMLRSKALEMGSATKFTAQEAAEGLNILAMSGYGATEAVGMIEDVLHLAAAGSMDMANAAGYISGAMKGFADDTKDAQYYADLMAKGATLANTDVAQLGDALSGGAAVAKSYGQSAETATLALLRLAEQGDTGSAASTALAAAMKNLYAPTDQAAKAMSALGVSAFDSNGAARDFNAVVNELNTAMADLTDQQRTQYGQTIFGIQGFDAYNKMVVTSTEKQEEWAAALAGASGEAARQYDTMTDNLVGDIDKWNSALDGARIALSDELTPSLREFVKFGADGMGALTTAFQEGGLEGAMNSLGGLLSVGLNLITSQIPFFMSAGMQLLGALGTGLIDNLPAITSALLAVVLMLADGLISALPVLAGAGAQIIAQLATGIGAALPELIPKAVEAIFAFLAGLTDGDSLNGLLDAAAVLVSGLIQGLGNALPKLLAYAPQIIGNLARGLINAIPRLLSVGAELLNGLMRGILSGIALIPITIVQLVDGLVNGFKDLLGIHSPSTVFAALGMDLIMGLFNGLSALWSIVTGFFDNAWAGILAGFDTFQSSLAQSFPLLAAIVQGPIDSIQFILAGLRGVLDGLIQFVTGVFTGNWTQTWEGVKSIFGSIFDSLAALVKQPINAVISIINRAISGINSLKLDIPDWVPILGGKTFGLNIPEIPQLAEGGIVTAPTLLEAGEAGNEAIIPLPELWGNMQELMADTMDNAVGRLADSLDTGNGEDVPSLAGLLDWDPEGPPDNGDDPPPPIVIYYQPHLHFEGGTPSKEDIVEAGRISQEEFNRMAAKWQKDAQRLSLRK